MTLEEAIKNLKKLKSFHNGSYGTAIDMAIKALEQEPCEDAISREALRQKLQEKNKDFFVNAYGSYEDMTFKDKARVDEIDNCIAMVVNAPSVTPKPKVGHWILNEYQGVQAVGYLRYHCSECGVRYIANTTEK